MKGGDGVRGFLRSVIYASRNEDVLLEMQREMKNAVERFKVGPRHGTITALCGLFTDDVCLAARSNLSRNDTR